MKIISFVFLVFILIFSKKSFAEINFFKLKNIHEQINSKYQHLSPIYGFHALQSGLLKNIRSGGGYGQEKDGIPCHRQIHGEQRKRDCPQNYTTALIQQLFPSPSGNLFIANQGAIDDPASRLTPQTIGNLLTQIELFKKNPNYSAEKLKEDFKDIIFQNSNLHKTSSLNIRKKWIMTQLEHCQEKPEIFKSSILSFQKDLSAIEEHLMKDEKTRSTDKSSKEWKQMDPFVDSLVGALFERKNNGYRYPKNIIENSLLGYFWRKSNDKEDILSLWKGMKIFINDSSLFEKESTSKNVFLESEYTTQDYNDWIGQHNSNFRKLSSIKMNEFLNNPEKQFFYFYHEKFLNVKIPRPIGYSRAAHKSLGKIKDDPRKYNFYSDCNETLLRNFINIILYDSDKSGFDVSLLKKIAKEHELNLFFKKGKKLDKGLVPFYDRNADPSNTSNALVHDDWSRRVVSNLNTNEKKSIHYLKPAHSNVCEMKAGLSNTVSVLEALLGDEKKENSLHSLSKQAENSPEKKFEILSKKLDRICEIFSRNGLILDWKEHETNSKEIHSDNNIKIQFTVNDQPQFKWVFYSNHAVLEAQVINKNNSWISQLSDLLVESPSSSIISKKLDVKELLPWIVEPENFSELVKKHPDPETIYSLSLDSNDLKLMWIDSILSQKKKEYYPEILQLIRKIPLDDFETQVSLITSLTRLKNQQDVTEFDEIKRYLEDKIKQSPSEFMSEAIYSDNLKLFKFILKLHPEAIFYENKTNGKIINDVASTSNLKFAEFLFDHYYDEIKKFPHYKITSLNSAAKNGELEMMKLLLEKYYPNHEQITGLSSPLMNAIINGKNDIVEYLAKIAPQIILEKNIENKTSIHTAVIEKNLNSLVILLQNIKSNYPNDWKDNGKSTPLFYAVHAENLDIAKALLEKIPSMANTVSDHFDNPLVLAIKKNNLNMIKFFMKNFPHMMDVKDNQGRTPLHTLFKNGHLEVINFFLDHFISSNKNILEFIKERDLISIAFESKNEKMIKILIEKNIPGLISMKDNNEKTMLHYSVQNMSLSLVKDLINKSPESVQWKDKSGKTPLHYAASNGNSEMIKYLFDKAPEAIYIKDNDEAIPLIGAIINGKLDAIEYLLKKAPETIHWKNKKGSDSLTIAKKGYKKNVISFLENFVKSYPVQ